MSATSASDYSDTKDASPEVQELCAQVTICTAVATGTVAVEEWVSKLYTRAVLAIFSYMA